MTSLSHIDPVCGMTVTPETAAGSTTYEGTTYYFCGAGCLKRFEASPQSFLSSTAPVSQPPVASPLGPTTTGPIEYTCPMHPQIVRAAPGACPICGMALEPRTITLDDGPNPELIDMTRRFWIAALLSVPIFVTAMADMIPGAGRWLTVRGTNVLGLVLGTPVVLWAGWPFFVRAWSSIVNRGPNMFTLIGIGVGAAYGYSVAATIAPNLFPAGFFEHGMVPTYFDTAAVITTLVLLGQVLELRARSRTGTAIKQLLGLAPRTARVVQGGDDVRVAR